MDGNSRIALRSLRDDRVAKDAPNGTAQATRRLAAPCRFDAFQQRQDFRGRDLADRHCEMREGHGEHGAPAMGTLARIVPIFWCVSAKIYAPPYGGCLR